MEICSQTQQTKSLLAGRQCSRKIGSRRVFSSNLKAHSWHLLAWFISNISGGRRVLGMNFERAAGPLTVPSPPTIFIGTQNPNLRERMSISQSTGALALHNSLNLNGFKPHHHTLCCQHTPTYACSYIPPPPRRPARPSLNPVFCL